MLTIRLGIKVETSIGDLLAAYNYTDVMMGLNHIWKPTDLMWVWTFRAMATTVSRLQAHFKQV